MNWYAILWVTVGAAYGVLFADAPIWLQWSVAFVIGLAIAHFRPKHTR